MIKVTDRFYINASSTCYTLQEKTTIKDENSKNFGQEIFREVGYYSTIDACIRGILKTTTREYVGKEEVNTLKELLTEIKAQEELIQKFNLEV